MMKMCRKAQEFRWCCIHDFDKCFEFMQVESAIAVKLVSGGCSHDMMQVM